MAFDVKTHEILIKALGLEKLGPIDQQRIVEESGAVIYQMVLLKALEEMSDEQVDEFQKFLETNPLPEKVFAFFREKIPSFDEMIEKETNNYMADGQNIMSQIGK